jgi:hypothetical protein
MASAAWHRLATAVLPRDLPPDHRELGLLAFWLDLIIPIAPAIRTS